MLGSTRADDGDAVLVDPEVLRAFATQVDTAARAINGTGVAEVATTSADGVAGSGTQWAARQVGHHLGLSGEDIANDITAMGSAVRGAGDRYEVDDATLSGMFGQLF